MTTGWATAAVLISAPAPIAAQQLCEIVEMEWVSIGDHGNAADAQTGYGSVAYPYEISQYEVTNSQYAEFLNAVAATDTYSLYDPLMATNPPTNPLLIDSSGGIIRSGTSGSYTYSTASGRAHRPVNYVSMYDALRYANWLNNGRPTGPQNATTTEDGAYTFTGATAVGPRNAGASVFVTSEDEWYKAAYYDPRTGTYHDYPTGFDVEPICADPPSTLPNSANCIYRSDPRVGPAEVGSYPNSPSPYGTYDQGGNLWEWIESEFAISGGLTTVAARGGAYIHYAQYLAASERGVGNAAARAEWGFRVARLGEGPVCGELPASPLTIDDFEEGPMAFADTAVAGSGSTSQEQTGLVDVIGGTRLVELTGSASTTAGTVTATLAPVVGADDGLLLNWILSGTARIVYDGITGGLTASGSAGALDLDLSLFDSIIIEASEVTAQAEAQPTVSVWLWDSAGSQSVGTYRLENGANVFPLSSFNGVDLTNIKQIRIELTNFSTLFYAPTISAEASARILDISVH